MWLEPVQHRTDHIHKELRYAIVPGTICVPPSIGLVSLRQTVSCGWPGRGCGCVDVWMCGCVDGIRGAIGMDVCDVMRCDVMHGAALPIDKRLYIFTSQPLVGGVANAGPRPP